MCPLSQIRSLRWPRFILIILLGTSYSRESGTGEHEIGTQPVRLCSEAVSGGTYSERQKVDWAGMKGEGTAAHV